MIKEPVIEDLTNAISVTLHENFRIELDNEVLKAVQKCDIDVDKRKLTKLLQIAERLKQADARQHGEILCHLDCTAGIPNSEIFIQGYNQALKDIGGNNNG